MPRDSTHGRIADDVVKRLGDAAPFLREFRPLVQLGSVFPDVGFYFRKHHDVPPEVRGLCQRIHGSRGEDTYAFLRAVAGRKETAEDLKLQALLVGILTHVWADVVFHPMVIYLTGDYDSTSIAKARHHDFETVLERYTDARWGGDGFPMERLLVQAGSDLDHVLSRFFQAWPEALPQREAAVSAYLAGYRYFAWARQQFKSGWTTALRPFAMWFDKPLATLIYTPAQRRRLDELDGALEYRNPVSGEAERATLQELRERVGEQCAAFCRDYALPVLRGERAAGEIPVGPSLSYGIPGVDDSDARYFSEHPWKVT